MEKYHLACFLTDIPVQKFKGSNLWFESPGVGVFRMKQSIRTGFSFGITSGIITTLGLMVGLHSGTHSKLVVLGGILMIAIADAFSDALGIHISEEYKSKNISNVWGATISTFLSKFIFSLTFIVPVLLFKLSTAITVSIIWGLSLLSVLSYNIAKKQKVKPWKVVTEHLIIAAAVITITHFIGEWIARVFG